MRYDGLQGGTEARRQNGAARKTARQRAVCKDDS